MSLIILSATPHNNKRTGTWDLSSSNLPQQIFMPFVNFVVVKLLRIPRSNRVGPNAIRAERNEQETDSVTTNQETVRLLSRPFLTEVGNKNTRSHLYPVSFLLPPAIPYCIRYHPQPY